MVYLYIIQISHAFSIAHSSNLTHGIFDLTQVLCDSTMSTFKITNFRPWLAQAKHYTFNMDCKNADFKQLTKEEMNIIAKNRDLYSFGKSIYEIMIAQTSKGEKTQQFVVGRDTSTPTQEQMKEQVR